MFFRKRFSPIRLRAGTTHALVKTGIRSGRVTCAIIGTPRVRPRLGRPAPNVARFGRTRAQVPRASRSPRCWCVVSARHARHWSAGRQRRKFHSGARRVCAKGARAGPRRPHKGRIRLIIEGVRCRPPRQTQEQATLDFPSAQPAPFPQPRSRGGSAEEIVLGLPRICAGGGAIGSEEGGSKPIRFALCCCARTFPGSAHFFELVSPTALIRISSCRPVGMPYRG